VGDQETSAKQPPPADDRLTAPQVQLLLEWQQGLRIRHIAHNRAAARFDRRARIMGVAVVILSTFVGTSIFATLEGAAASWLRVVAALFSAVAAILAAVQTSLAYPQLAERHRVAGRSYGSLRREVEAFLASADGRVEEAIAGFRRRWDELASEAPEIGHQHHREARDATGVTRVGGTSPLA